jgi:hypothetical protein
MPENWRLFYKGIREDSEGFENLRAAWAHEF